MDPFNILVIALLTFILALVALPLLRKNRSSVAR